MDMGLELDAGSRMPLLDWLESPRFLPVLREFVAPIGFTIRNDAPWRPKGRKDYRESVLVGRGEPFLSADQQDKLCGWWLVHRRGATLPTWDLVVGASDESGRPALILVEATAHISELSTAGKLTTRRDAPDHQKRSDDNHEQIGRAIAQATATLCKLAPGISLSRAKSYQFATR